MACVTTPPYPPYAAPPPAPPPGPRRRRPSAWWFLLAGGLIVAGIAIGATMLVLTFKGLFDTDATVDADGRPHSVSVPTDGDRALWFETAGADPTCEVVDEETGDPVTLRDPVGSYTREDGGRGEQHAAWTFDAGSGDLRITCSPGSPERSTVVEIGPAPELSGFFGGIAIAIAAALLLGGGGFVLLVVIAILYATGRPRSTT